MVGNSTAAGARYDELKRKFRQNVTQSLQNNKAVGIGFCTRFLHDPDANTNFAEPGKCKQFVHGMHAMTIIGYRCGTNGIEYLLQNSWGVGCPYGEHIGCSSEDALKGQLWVGEDLLVRNTSEYNIISL